MGSERRTPGRDPPVAVHTELLHESERTRVSRLVFPAGSVIRKEPLGPGAQCRLRREVAVLERLSGAEGVGQLAAGAPSFPGSLVLADVGGTALSERTTPWDPARLVELGELLARAVAEMHRRGVVHRDINPANILVSSGGHVPYLIDFALATVFTAVQPAFLHHREIVGTVPYLAPEQTGRTGRPVDQRADLYAVGATLYELATGAPPFGAGDPLRLIHDHLARIPVPPSVVNPAVPAALSAIIMHLLAKEPDDRYQSADGLVHDLALVRRGATVVHPGEHDLLDRPLTPSRLAGRDREIDELQEVFAEAMADRCPGVLLGGMPGVGKTSLANELRPVVAGADGWFVTGKFDQLRRDREYDGVLQAFRALGRLLLAEPEECLAEARDRMLRALGPNAGLAAAAVPELAALLKVRPEPGDPMTAQVRAQNNAVEVLRAVASRKRPVVFFIDDLQWAGRTELGILDPILSGTEHIEGLLLVGTYRDSEVDAAHPLTPMLARWRRQRAGPRLLWVGNLTPEGQAAMVADLLHLDLGRAAELARLIAPSTGGNPCDTMELLGALRHDGILAPCEGGWRWEQTTLRRRLHHVEVPGLSTARMASLPPGTRETLVVMACLASRVEMGLLEVATGLAGDELERRLAPAFAAGLLVLESDGRRSVRFRHDRTQESVLDGLTSRVGQAVRLGLARRLADRHEFFAAAAEQYLLVADAVHAEQERQLMVGLFRWTADRARMLSDYPLAGKFLTAAVKFIDPTDTDQLLAVHIDRHAALYSLGRLEEADEEYQAISRLCTHPVGCAAATAVQVSSLFNRHRVSEALRLGLEALQNLGLAVPDRDHLDAEIDRGLDELYQWIDQTSASDDLCRPEISDRLRLGAIQIIDRVMSPAFYGDQTMLAWLAVTTLRMWARDGPDPALVGPCGCGGSVIISRRHDYPTAYRMMRRILEVSRMRGYEPHLWLAQFLYVAFAGHWFDPLEDNVPAARRALEGLVRGGDLQNACHTHYVLIYNLLDSASSLDVVAAEVDEAIAFAVRIGNGQAEDAFRTYRQLARVLRGEAAEPAADEAAVPSLLATDLAVVFHLHVAWALAAAILGRPADLDRHTAAVMPLLPTFETNYPTAVARVLRMLALAGRVRAADEGEHDALVAELDELVAWLAKRAVDAPVNFSHLLRLVEAERAWAVGDFRTAVYAFDVAQREAAGRTRPWHRALILERAARFYLAHGIEEAGRGLLAAARSQYAAWGAAAKVSQLDYAHPALRIESAGALPAAQPPAQPAGSRVTVTTGTVDLLGVVAASQTLSSETGIDGLRSKLGGVLRDMTGATGVCLLLRDREERGWSVPVDDGGAVSLEEAGRRRLLPPSVIWYAERTHEPVVVADATRDDRFVRDPYVTGLDRCSLLAIPIMIQGELRAMLLLENRLIRGAFTTERLEGIMLIAGQLAVSLDNALVYASLERKVAERTEQLATANRRLEQLSATDPLTGLANRRQLDEVLDAEWHRAQRQATPLALAMIDIDHFKSYNDHYGHAAGDRCLQRVAACVDAGTRHNDLAARYGGEEFAVVMPGTDTATAAHIAHRLRAAIAELAEPHPPATEWIVTVSIGVAAITPTRDDDTAALVELADAALYRAKSAGRNRVEATHPLPTPQ
ncbi:diguanylate cyclase [Pseudofrankia asymbiotica]|uniref:Serine/threonine protein kinase n=1 Tax=Pseudofrankia asymbiotica TaxID=1834516 RepID=A0A1V2I078_9ACTN|nr:diguanylate cyclase [Pseudofrankia asymbiotica]ONH22207.1 serine/threonine protein kinase [Pseudofrankia asymbiotica]